MHDSSSGSVDAVLCCIAKNELPYLEEWMTYHLSLGFARVYVYDNSDDYELEGRYDAKYVEVVHLPGPRKQLMAYHHFLKNYGKQHMWVAFFDVDEFIVLRRHTDILAFLRDWTTDKRVGAIALNWLMFGSNDLESYDPRPVLQRFTKCAKTLSPYVKVIVKVEDVHKMTEPHFAQLRAGKCQKYIDKRVGQASSMYTPRKSPTEVDAVLHHYFVKSKEEFKKKIQRRKAFSPNQYTMNDFSKRDYHDMENTDALECFRKALEEGRVPLISQTHALDTR